MHIESVEMDKKGPVILRKGNKGNKYLSLHN